MDKGKIGIITYHFAANYGAVLQCYALEQCLKRCGYNPYVINYVSDIQKNNNSLYRSTKNIKGLAKNLLLIPFHFSRKRRIRRFNAFLTSKIRINKDKRISTISDLKDNIEFEDYKYIISGSDQVWNPDIKDFDSAFFYPFQTKSIKIGYAVSTGRATLSMLTPYREHIEAFSKITVREKSTAEILSKLTNKPLVEVCDPVFLMTKEEWCREVKPIDDSKYLLCYFVGTSELKEKIRVAKKIALEKKLKLIILSARITKYNICEKVYSDCGPLEFLSLFFHADYICTDSFHGTAFSLIFNKQFITLERKAEKNDGRKTGLLKNVGAFGRIQYLDEKIHNLEDIDYNSVNEKILEMRKTSSSILLDMLN